MIKFFYWAFVALDLAALLFFAVLSLAAAGSAKTAPMALALTMLLPALPLVGSVWLFVRSRSSRWRGLAFALAAAPLCFIVVTTAINDARIRTNTNAQGDLTFFAPGPQRELAEAIQRHDALAVAVLATRANVSVIGMKGMTPLVLALRQLRIASMHQDAQQEVLKALLAAGARPNLNGASGGPIFFAAAGRGAHPDTLALMIRHGADLRAAGPGGETVLVYAATASSWRVVDFLRSR